MGQETQRAEREREVVEKLSTALELPALILSIDGKNAAVGRRSAVLRAGSSGSNS